MYATQTGSGTAVALPQGQCAQDLAAHYTIQLSATNAVTSNSYEIDAVPQGVQATKDTKCATLSVNQAGRKKVSNTATAVKDCW